MFSTANDAYDTITKVLTDKGGLAQGTLTDDEFDALFTAVDENGDAKVVWTIYGEQTMTEDNTRPSFMSFGRKASHYGKRHFSRFEFVGGNSNAKLKCSTLTFPYEWWGERHASEVSFKNLQFELNDSTKSFGLSQANNDGLVALYENCTFNGAYYFYNNSKNSLTFNDCKFVGGKYSLHVQGSATEVTEVTINGCKFEKSRGINIDQATAVATIEGNTFTNCGNQTNNAASNHHHSAIQITRGSSITINNNTIQNATGTAIYVRGNGTNNPFKGTLKITNNKISKYTYAFCDKENGDHDIYTLVVANNTITDTATDKCSVDNTVYSDVPNYLGGETDSSQA